MSSPKQFLANLLAPLIFTRAKVAQVEPVGQRFRRVALEGEGLKSASWQAGDKVRLFFSDAGLRAYTPIDWDDARGRTHLLVYVHDERGTAPGAAWARRVQIGDELQLLGPQRSLKLDPSARSTILFGDETSIGVAKALSAVGPCHAVLEASDVAQAQAVLEALGLADAIVLARAAEDGHLADAQAAIAAARARLPGAALICTGRAQSIHALKLRLKSAGAAPARLTRAYWAVGKTGLE